MKPCICKHRIILFNHSGVKGFVAMIQDGKTMKVKNDKLGSINFFNFCTEKKITINKTKGQMTFGVTHKIYQGQEVISLL